MTRFLVAYHGSEMPYEPEAIAQARDAFIQWAGKTGARPRRSRRTDQVVQYDRSERDV